MNHRRLCPTGEHSFSRRQWLGSVAGGAMGTLGLDQLLRSADPKGNKQVLFIWLDGGISQLETWDPKPGTQFGGPFRTIPTSVTGIHISELLPKTAKQMHHLALVRSLCTKDNSHSAGVGRIQRGDPKNRGVIYPYLGSAMAYHLGPGQSGLPPYVWIKPGSGGFMHRDAGFLGPKYGALAFGDGKPPENLLLHPSITESEDEARNSLREKLDQNYAASRRKKTAEAMNYVFSMASKLRRKKQLFDASTFSDKDKARYGTHEFGRHMLLARRMLEAGVTFVKVNSYGWDTHGDNFNGHASLVPKVDQAFAAMIEDLADRSMLDNVLVILMSEFGRTPRINGHVGRDHWPEAWSLAMTGPKVKRGVVVGKTNDQGTWVTSDELDIGHMFQTWFHCIGIDPVETIYRNQGQPLPIAHDECHVVKELLV